MKISNMDTKTLAATLCKIAKPLGEIAKDEKINQLFISTAAQKDKGKTVLSVFSGFATDIVPIILEDHQKAFFEVVSVLSGKTLKQIENQNAMETIREVKDILSDGELVSFFSSLRGTVASV